MFRALFTSCLALARQDAPVNSFRGSAKHRFAVNAKTTTRGPDTSAPQSLFSHLYFWLAMFRGVIYVACLALARQDALREQLRGSAKHRFAVNAKTTTRGPDTSAPQSLFSHLYFWLAMFRGVIYVACLALARQDALREQLSRLGKAPLRCKRKTTTRGPDTSAPQSLFSHLCLRHSLCPSPCRYFLTLGASIMFIFLPSSFGIISTLANSSRSVAKRKKRISPCSLKTIERPRKKT